MPPSCSVFGTGDDLSTMQKNQFKDLLDDCDIAPRKNLKSREVDMIFALANQEEAEDSDDEGKSPDVSGMNDANPDNARELHCPSCFLVQCNTTIGRSVCGIDESV